MITNPKSLIDMGANAAIMAAFPLPGGAVIAAGIATGVVLFDIFYEPPAGVDPGSMAADRNDLDNAVNKLEQFITDALFNSVLNQYSAQVLTLNDQLARVWGWTPTGDAVKDRSRRGPFLQNNASTATVDSWMIEINGYKETILKSKPELLEAATWIEQDSLHTNQTLGLYTLTASLWLNFCKLNIAYEFILASRDYDRAETKYHEAANNYQAALNVWKLVGRDKGEPEPLAPVAPDKPLDDENFLNGSTFADKAKSELVRFLKYAEPIVALLRGNFNKRAAELKERLEAVTLASAGGKWFYTDGKTGKSSNPTPYRQIADGQMQAYKGSIQVSLWDRLTTQYGLAQVEEADLLTLATTIAEWNKAKDTFAPK